MKSFSAQDLHKVLQKPLPKSSVLLDVRTPSEYRAEHIAAARNVPLDTIDDILPELESYEVVYVQCRSGNRSTQACEKLGRLNFKHLYNIDGGIEAWKSAGFHTVKGKQSYSIFQQVQMIAGTLVLLGIVLGYFFDPRFVLVSAFVGAGLLFSGLTGTCAMGTCLSKMPWNK